MKIDEAIKNIKKTTAIQVKQESEQEGSLMTFYAYGRSYNNDWFLAMRNDTPGWFGVEINYRYIKGVSAKELACFMDIIQKLLNTPVDDRFPEKKYRLRWIDSKAQEGPATYLGRTGSGDSIYWSTFSVVGAETFTEPELEQLKKDNPRLAPAIDAMKEPAEDKDE